MPPLSKAAGVQERMNITMTMGFSLYGVCIILLCCEMSFIVSQTGYLLLLDQRHLRKVAWA